MTKEKKVLLNYLLKQYQNESSSNFYNEYYSTSQINTICSSILKKLKNNYVSLSLIRRLGPVMFKTLQTNTKNILNEKMLYDIIYDLLLAKDDSSNNEETVLKNMKNLSKLRSKYYKIQGFDKIRRAIEEAPGESFTKPGH